MKDLKTLIAEAKKKAPSLNYVAQPDAENVVLFEKKPAIEDPMVVDPLIADPLMVHPMIVKLNRHRSSLQNHKLEQNDKNHPSDWQNYKNSIIMNIETKRKEEWENQKAVDSMNDSEEELEELNEDEDEEVKEDGYADDDLLDEVDSGSGSQKESQDEVEKILGGEDDDDDGGNEDDDDEDEDVEELDEDEGTSATKSSKSRSRTLLDSDDDDDEGDDDNDDLRSAYKKSRKLIIDDDDEFIPDDNAIGFDSQGSLEHRFRSTGDDDNDNKDDANEKDDEDSRDGDEDRDEDEDEDHEEEKKILTFKSQIYCQGGGAIFNAEDGDSNDVLEFCSGQFATQKPPFGHHSEGSNSGLKSVSGVSENLEDVQEEDEDEEEDKDEEGDEVQFEEGHEEFIETEYYDPREVVIKRKQGGEPCEIVIEPRKKNATKLRKTDFLEEEAELSGSDDGESDGEDGEDLNEYEEDEEDEDLPDDEDIRRQVDRLYKKQELDEDKRRLLLLQERYLEDGDLYDGKDRVRKFKWNLHDEDNDFVNILSDSDEDNSQDSDDDYESSAGMIQLKRPIMKTSQVVLNGNSNANLDIDDGDDFEIDEVDAVPRTTIEKLDSNDEVIQVSNTETETSNSRSVTFSQALESTSMFRQSKIKQKAMKVTKVSSFFLKDDRLKSVLNKRPSGNGNDQGPGPSKRSRMDDDSSSKSIFDLL